MNAKGWLEKPNLEKCELKFKKKVNWNFELVETFEKRLNTFNSWRLIIKIYQ